MGRLRSMWTTCSSARSSTVVSGEVPRGVAFELLEKDAVGGDLAEGWRSAEHDTAMADRARRAVARQADHPHVVAEVLAAELRADAERLRELEHLRFELGVAEAVAERVARGRQACRGSAPRRSLAVFIAYSAEVPPITTARWYGGHAAVPSERSFSSRNFIQALRVQQGLGLLEEVALVGRAAALGHEQELVVVARPSRRSRSAPAGCCRC